LERRELRVRESWKNMLGNVGTACRKMWEEFVRNFFGRAC